MKKVHKVKLVQQMGAEALPGHYTGCVKLLLKLCVWVSAADVWNDNHQTAMTLLSRFIETYMENIADLGWAEWKTLFKERPRWCWSLLKMYKY